MAFKNKEDASSYRRTWAQRNPEKQREANRRYRAKMTPEKREEVSEKRREYAQGHRETISANQWKRRASNPERYLWEGAKGRARRKGIPFTITPEDIVIPECCPVFGVPLEFNFGLKGNNSPSLDRIIPELGYVPGNIQVISIKANTMKNDASPDDLQAFARWVLGREAGEAATRIDRPVSAQEIMDEIVDADVVPE